MINSQSMHLKILPSFFFINKQRILGLKKKKKKKKFFYCYLISKRNTLNLFSKRYQLDYFLYNELIINTRKLFQYVYNFTLDTGLKTKNEIKDFYRFYKILDVERVQSINYVNFKLYNKNKNIYWLYFKYLNLNIVNKKMNNLDSIINNLKLYNKQIDNKIFIGVMPDYYKWLYIYNIYTSNIKFKYLHSYNYLTKIKFKKFNWFLYNNKNKVNKKKLLLLKLKNKNIFIFFYNYLFYSELFNKTNIIQKQYFGEFNFFYNSLEYLIATNYLNIEELELDSNFKNYPYYFNTNYFVEKKNIYLSFFNNNIKEKKFFSLYKLKIYYIFFFSVLNTKIKNILRYSKKKKKINKKKKKKIFIYYFFLIEFIMLFFKYTNSNNNNSISYSVYKLKLSWLLNKKK